MVEVPIGETYAYLIAGGRKSDVIDRVLNEEKIQEIVEENTKYIFGQNILWISQKATYGDMFGLAEDRHLVIVEIKGRKSRGYQKISYGLGQIREKFTKVSKIRGKINLQKIWEKYNKGNFTDALKRKLNINYKNLRIDYKPRFYFISTQFKQKVIKSAEQIAKKRWVGRWRPTVQCILVNIFKRGKKEILVITRYV